MVHLILAVLTALESKAGMGGGEEGWEEGRRGGGGRGEGRRGEGGGGGGGEGLRKC